MAVIGNSATQQAFTPAIDYFSGNGSTTAFTLSRPVASVAQVQVTIDNVAQNPSSAYTVSANTITFTSAPLSGTNNIYVYYTSPITQVIAPSQGTVDATSLASSTGTGAVVLATSPTITTPTISSISSASATALTLKSAGTTAVTIDTSQNVGIGTASPVSKLNVNGGSVTLAETTTGAYNIDFQSRTASTNARIQYDQLTNTTGQLLFYTNGGSLTERMRIDSSGNLLVGRTAQTPYTNVGFTVTSSGRTEITRVTGGDAIAFYVSASGNNVGTIVTNASTTSYNTSSDYRLKENIAPMTGALAKVALLKPSTYKWKVDGADGEGFIAHELAEVCPHAVNGEKDAVDADGNPKYQGIDTSFLVATLTAALQETKALIDQQAETLSQQAETINALTARIEALENR